MKRYRPLWANEKKIFFLRRNIPFSGLNSVQSKTKQKWSLPKEIILWVSARWLVFDMSCKENIYNFSKMTLCPLPVYFYFPKMKAKFQFGRLCWCACLVVLIVSDSVWFYALQPTSLLCPWDSPGKNTRGGCHALLWGSASQPRGWTVSPVSPCIAKWVLFYSATWEAHLDEYKFQY